MGSPITIPGEGSPFIPPHKPPPPPPPKETSVLSFPLHKGQSRTHYKAKRIHRPHNPWRPEEKTSPRPEKTVHLLPNQSLDPLHDVPGIFPRPVPTASPCLSASFHAPACLLLARGQGSGRSPRYWDVPRPGRRSSQI